MARSLPPKRTGLIFCVSLYIYIYILYTCAYEFIFVWAEGPTAGARNPPPVEHRAYLVAQLASQVQDPTHEIPPISSSLVASSSRPRSRGTATDDSGRIVGIGGTFKHRQDGLPPRTSKGIQVHPAEAEPRGVLSLYGVAGPPRCLEGNWTLHLRSIIVQLMRTPE